MWLLYQKATGPPSLKAASQKQRPAYRNQKTTNAIELWDLLGKRKKHCLKLWTLNLQTMLETTLKAKTMSVRSETCNHPREIIFVSK